MMTEEAGDEQNPFLRYRRRLDSYRAVRDSMLSDESWVDLVGRLDAAVEEVDGRGFRVTPVVDGSGLLLANDGVGEPGPVSVKVDLGNVAGSHKARHLFGVAIHLLVAESLGRPLPAQLAIASCGNAALAAGVVARAMDLPLRVFVPTWADQVVVDRLVELGSVVERCERRPGEVGDPAYLRFREAVAGGARAFSVQGTDTPTTFDGGRTLGWEIEDQVGAPDVIYVQVGGGALATSVAMALPATRIHPVQAEGCAPLARAWDQLGPTRDLAAAERDPDRYMWAWDNPTSVASGILDDITYDWLPLLRQTVASGGWPVVAPEAAIESAYELAGRETGLAVSATGSAGLAGLLAEPPQPGEHAVVIFTGVDRS